MKCLVALRGTNQLPNPPDQYRHYQKRPLSKINTKDQYEKSPYVFNILQVYETASKNFNRKCLAIHT